MTIRFGDSGSQSKVGPLYFGDGKGNAIKCGVMFYGDGKGNAIKVYSNKYSVGHALWKATNTYGIGLGNKFQDSPYVIPGSNIVFPINTKLLPNGIKVIFNTAYYYGNPYYTDESGTTTPLWDWNGPTIPGNFSNSYFKPSSSITIPKSDFGNLLTAYTARKQGNQVTVTVIASSNGLLFSSSKGGSIFDIPTSNGYSILLVERVEAY